MRGEALRVSVAIPVASIADMGCVCVCVLFKPFKSHGKEKI